MLLQNYLDQLGLEINQTIRLNNRNATRLNLEHYQIHIEAADNGDDIFFSAMLCRLPSKDERLTLLDKLMEAHSFGFATDNAYFGANPHDGQVYLFKRLNLEATVYEGFKKELESFIHVFRHWKDLYDSGELCSSGEAPAPTYQDQGVWNLSMLA